MDVESVANGYLAVFGEFPRKARIETQIHRRRAAKPLSALVLEWEQAKPTAPDERADLEQL
ncbi:MAG: hypothetical protein U0236_20905 [Nitrospira sp.]